MRREMQVLCVVVGVYFMYAAPMMVLVQPEFRYASAGVLFLLISGFLSLRTLFLYGQPPWASGSASHLGPKRTLTDRHPISIRNLDRSGLPRTCHPCRLRGSGCGSAAYPMDGLKSAWQGDRGGDATTHPTWSGRLHHQGLVIYSIG
jgi:hypothetical protein